MKKGCPIFTDWTTFFPHTSRMRHAGLSWGSVLVNLNACKISKVIEY